MTLKKSISAFLFVCGAGGAVFLASSPNLSGSESAREAESVRFFEQASSVFQHPRCLNCHPGGDRPTQGMDLHEHTMNVQRGLQNHGAAALQCSACHGVENNLSSGVPGAPKWALAPKTMAWQGLSKGDLCRKLKGDFPNGRMAGGMSPEEFIRHNGEDALVGWAWKPGKGREPAPLTQKKFGGLVAKWIRSGAACPP
ncbi:MAG: Isoquinoline 1-oxidoreductase subunit [Cryobacterium sp.]|nr:Isoquinoline 1-oxidoreductase subunit [Oligoflexia bacterium]